MRVYCQRVFNFPISARGIIYNGRLIGPLNDNEQFYIEDLALLERFSNMMYGDKLKAILKNGKEFQGNDGYCIFCFQVLVLLYLCDLNENYHKFNKS